MGVRQGDVSSFPCSGTLTNFVRCMVCRADKTQGNKTMKKLIVALAAVAVGFAANAASFSWEVSSGRLFDGTGTTGSAGYSPSVGLAVYLFDAGVYSQSTLVAAFSSASGVDYTKSIGAATTVVNSVCP